LAATSQISQPHVIASRVGRNAQRVKKEDCESSPLASISVWLGLRDQEFEVIRQRLKIDDAGVEQPKPMNPTQETPLTQVPGLH
jgi:hypothetical protein